MHALRLSSREEKCQLLQGRFLKGFFRDIKTGQHFRKDLRRLFSCCKIVTVMCFLLDHSGGNEKRWIRVESGAREACLETFEVWGNSGQSLDQDIDSECHVGWFWIRETSLR